MVRVTGAFAILILGGCTAIEIHAHGDGTDSAPEVRRTWRPCPMDPLKKKSRSEELQTIVAEDQTDRTEPIDWEKVSPRDEARRKRIGEIFGEGCFSQARDYAAAALVFQHGVLPEHYFQTYLWAKKAVDLGDASERRLMAMGIDRYLVNTGHRQLFATQASKPSLNDECWCMEAIEETYPEEQRAEISGQTRERAWAWIDSLNVGHACPVRPACPKRLAPSPRGTIPGFW